MDTEKKPENEEDDNGNKEAKDSRTISSHDVDLGPVSDVIADSSVNSTSKRGFSESSDFGSVIVEENGNKHASKRMKLAEVEPPKSGEQGIAGSESSESAGPERSVPLEETRTEALLGDSDGGTCLPSAFVPPCDLSAVDAVPMETLQVPVAQTHRLQKIFSCELCGFQCVEENLLNAHYLGKTHLRRQNLVARGGFVQILTKQPFPKKPCPMGTKNVRTKPRASKPLAKNSESKGLRNTESKCKDFRGTISKHGGGSSELLVEMVPSGDSLSEKVDFVEENVTSLSTARNPDSQSEKLGALVTSESLLDKLESTRNSPQAAHGVGAASRPRPERNFLVLGSGFRRRSGTFSLKGQAKKRFGLLGINKRGSNETQRLYMRHFRKQVKTSEAESTPQHVETSGSVRGPCLTSSETQDPKQDRRNSHLPCSLDSLTVRPAPDHQVLCACADCGHTATDRTELEIHGEKCQAGKTCGLSSVSGRDLDGHLHPQTASGLSCQCCPSLPVSEEDLREPAKEKRSPSLLCAPRDLFFVSEKDVDEHRTTEKHIHSSAQPKTSQSLGADLALQTFPLSTSESENTKDSVSEPGRAAQEEPVKSRVSPGNEVRHSSRPQFQCKKCFYKTRSSTVLTRHIKLRHGQDYHFLCKACNLYSLSKEGMEKHIKRSKHLENAKKNNIGLSFEECIERVCIGANDRKEEANVPGGGRAAGHGEGTHLAERSGLEQSVLPAPELPQSGVIAKEGELALATTPKRGRPKGNISRTCSHCGLLASSITNLTVHIRRKHSHQYSYLCKVCKYYTVTKGDMERHCATKKHKGRVEIEASGKQSSDVVVGPEGGDLEASRKNAGSAVSGEPANRLAEAAPSTLEKPELEHGNPAEVKADSVFHSLDGDANSHLEKKEQVSPEPEDLPHQGGACAQGDVTGTGDNKCIHCEFNAHSSASLELHVKRKHTKEFTFYCMACDYYAVTRREMTRHAATEKHKMKRQSYLSSSSLEAASAEMSRDTIVPEELHQQNAEEFQVIPHQSSETLKSRSGADCSVLEENANLDMSKVLCAPDSVEIETEEESNLSEDHSFCETLRQPLAKDKVLRPEEMVSLISSNDGSSAKFPNENSGNSALNYETAKRMHNVLSDIDISHAHGQGDGGRGGEKAENALGRRACPGALDGERAAESATGRVAGGRLPLRSGGQDGAGSLQSPGDLRHVPGGPVLENKESLMSSQHETKIILEEDGLASDSTVENNDVYETIISIDEKGQAVYSSSRFDSSIIKIKNPEDGELLDQSEEALVAAGVRISELPLKDCAQGGKKKKSEGSSFAESTRIRCDDCGFLADGLSGLNVHIAMKHPTKEKHFHCLLCGKSFYTESNLHQHLASAGHMRNEQASVEELPEGGATFKCVKCTEPFDSEQNLFLHIKGQHEELLREVNKYIVEDTEQINREREENQGNVCKYCGKMCRSSNSMAFLAHIRTHTGSKPFKCKICHFATAQLGDARNHVKRHLGMREYKCHVCGVAFVMKKHLNTHLLGKHGVGTPKERKFSCHLCDRSFTEKWALNNHMKLHTGEKPFKCTWPTCHYSFLTASAMKDHYRTHTGEKSFLCDLCGFAGGTRHALTKHRRQHTGEKPFKCDECNFASTTQSHLTRHKRVHTGEKPYRCPWCDYRSNCAENIRKHILHTGKHEGVKMYNCPRCDHGTNVPAEFRNHLKEQHPDVDNPDLAYLHAGIVSKSYECRLKGQGATFVETDSPFTAAALAEESPVKDRPLRGSRRPAAPPEPVQQVIIIQGYDGEFALDASVEETAAATLQTLALAGQVARVVHITEDSQERSQAALKKVVQGVLQFAVCDPAAAGQLVKDGVTQVIVNAEGAVHMLARDGAQIVMQEAGAPDPHADLAESDGEISQIIVTEELVQAMVQESGGSFPEGATHYIVTELPPGVQDGAGVFSHTVIEAAGSQEILQAGAALSAEAVVPGGTEQLTSMVIYTQEGSPAAAVIQSQRESSDLHEA
nr:zinc finger protein 407 [Vicugna pacos]